MVACVTRGTSAQVPSFRGRAAGGVSAWLTYSYSSQRARRGPPADSPAPAAENSGCRKAVKTRTGMTAHADVVRHRAQSGQRSTAGPTSGSGLPQGRPADSSNMPRLKYGVRFSCSVSAGFLTRRRLLLPSSRRSVGRPRRESDRLNQQPRQLLLPVRPAQAAGPGCLNTATLALARDRLIASYSAFCPV
jgi:hypothetical protein